MELKQIKELMAAMGRTGTKRLTIKKENFELHLERDEGRLLEPVFESEDSLVRQDNASQRVSMALRGKDGGTQTSLMATEPKEETASVYVTSPMVGSFYASPSPEDPSFVKVGDRIEKNTVVCIIEAMKVMNEVKAGVSGVVAEILVENGHPVEFGTKLFKIT